MADSSLGMDRSRPASPSAVVLVAGSCGPVRQPGTPVKLSPPQKRRRRLQYTAAKAEREVIEKGIQDIVSQKLDILAKKEREEIRKIIEGIVEKMLKDSFENNKLLQGQVEANMDSKLKRAFDQIKMLKSEWANLQEKYDAARQRLGPEVSDATSGSDYEDEDEASHMQCMHALAEEMAGRRVSKARFNWVLDEWERNTGEEFNAEAVTAAFDSGFFDDNCRKRLPTCCATAKSS